MVKPLVSLPETKKGNRIAFIGPMCSGKTWSATYLVDNYDYSRASLAGKLKAIAYEMYGITGKDGNDRIVLQELGTDLRKHDEDVWLKYLLEDISTLDRQYNQLKLDPPFEYKPVIDDVRYINEANILRQNGFVLIRIDAPIEIRSGRVTHLYPNRPVGAVLHASETEQEGIVADYTIINNDESGAINLEILMEQLHG